MENRYKDNLSKNKEITEYEQLLADMRTILETDHGIRFLRYVICELCHVFSTSYTGNAYTYLNEGERNVGLKIMKKLEHITQDNPELRPSLLRIFFTEKMFKPIEGEENARR